MKLAVGILCLITLSQSGAPKNLQFGANDFLQFSEGFLVGIGIDLQLNDIVDCIEDVDNAITYALDAEKYCKDDNIWDKTECLYYKAEALKQIPGAILNCKSAYETDAQKVENAIKQIQNPISVVYHVGKEFIFNGAQIYNEFTSACNYWSKGDYYDSGVQFGKVFGIVFVTDGSNLATISGFLKGTDVNVQLNDIYSCIEYEDLAKQLMSNGLKGIQEVKSNDDAESALLKIGGYFKLVYHYLESCDQDPKTLQFLQKQIDLANSDIEFKDNNIFLSGNNVTSELIMAIVQIMQEKYHLASMHLGQMLIKLTENKDQQFIKGILKANYLNSDAEICLAYLNEIAGEFIQIYNQIIHQDIQAAINTAKAIASILSQLTSECNPLLSSSYLQTTSATNFNQEDVAYFFNLSKISYEENNLDRAGFFFGLALNEIRGIQLQAFPKTKDILQILNGTLHGMASEVTIGELQTCIIDAQDIGYHLYTSILLLKQGTMTSVKNALYGIGESFQQVPDMIQDCTQVLNDSNGLSNAIKAIQSPFSFFFSIGEALIVNGKDIYEDVKKAVKAWDQEDWYDFGLNIGLALDKVVS